MKRFMAAVVGLFLITAPVQAGNEPTEMWGYNKNVCYRLKSNYRVVRTVCNADKWPNSEFRGRHPSVYTLNELLDLGSRFKQLGAALKRLFK